MISMCPFFLVWIFPTGATMTRDSEDPREEAPEHTQAYLDSADNGSIEDLDEVSNHGTPNGDSSHDNTKINETDPRIETDVRNESKDSDDEYVISDDEDLGGVGETLPNSISDQATFLSNSLEYAMDSLELDKSLVLQAQLSGKLNNENLKLIEKREQLVESLAQLREKYTETFVPHYDPITKTKWSMVEQMHDDLRNLEVRLDKLKNGGKKGNNIFGSTRLVGIAKEYPVEYNQARDKIIERQ